MSVVSTDKLTYITRENAEVIPDSVPGELWIRTGDSWYNFGDMSEMRLSSQRVIYDRDNDRWLEIVTSPHCSTCTC